ncbi:MAG: hypothetical protein KAI50_08180, partial [Desulfobacterales bacterium]|nr:hypothetical protein [Desulfobacterales bacterium]
KTGKIFIQKTTLILFFFCLDNGEYYNSQHKGHPKNFFLDSSLIKNYLGIKRSVTMNIRM